MPVIGVCFLHSLIYSYFYFQNLFFLFFLSSFLASFVSVLSCGGAGFESLSLDFSEQEESLLLEPWDCTFEEVLWDRQWSLR